MREADSVFPRNSPIINMLGYARLHSACKASIDYLVRKRTLIIGRSGFDADCQIRSDSRAISRHHARLFWDEDMDQWAIECLSVKNGLLVDGTPLVYGSPHLYLRSKNLIEMGDVAFFFLLSSEATFRTGDIERTEELVLEMRNNRKRKRAGGGGGSSRKRAKPPLMPRSSSKKASKPKKKEKQRSAAADVETDDSSRDDDEADAEERMEMQAKMEDEEIDDDNGNREAESVKHEKTEAELYYSRKTTPKNNDSRSSGASPDVRHTSPDRDSEPSAPLPPPPPPREASKKRKTKKEAKPVGSSSRKRKGESPAVSMDGLAMQVQYREEWFKKEKADFSRALNAVGADPIKNDVGDTVGYDWTRFRRIAELPKKSDEQLEAYYLRIMADVEALLEEEDREKRTKGPRTKHKPGCVCVVCTNTRKSRAKKREENTGEEETPAPPPPPEEEEAAAVKSTARAGDRLVGLVTAQKLRVRFGIHGALRQVDSDAGKAVLNKIGSQSVSSTDLPDWWQPGNHDRALLLGARKHGVGMWMNIWNDVEIDEFATAREDVGPDIKWPSPQTAMKRLREITNSINSELRRLSKKEARMAEKGESAKSKGKGKGGKAKESKAKSKSKKAKEEDGAIAKLKDSLAKRVGEIGDGVGAATQSEGSRSKASSPYASDAEPEYGYDNAEPEPYVGNVEDDDDLDEEMVVEAEYTDDEPVPELHQEPEQTHGNDQRQATDSDDDDVEKVEYETSSESE